MAVVVFPVDAVTGAPSYTGRMARETLSPLLAGATSARPLGARSGVRPGTSTTTVTATSTTWTINNHAGILDMETAAEAGPYAYAVNTAQTGAVTAADATRPRIDLVWVRLDDPAESDGSAVPAVVAGYTAGAPLAAPVAPATPARCMVLATINVPLSGGGSPTVIWAAPYTVAAGGVLPVPAGIYPATPYVGQYVDDVTLGLLRWNGTTWTDPLAAIGVQVGKNATQSAPAATPTIVLFPTEDWDSSAFHDLVTNNSRLTIPAGLGGKYLVKGKVDFTGATTPGFTILSINKNNAPAVSLIQRTLALDNSIIGDTTMVLAAGDYIELIVTVATTSTMQSSVSDTTPCYFSAVRFGA